MIKGLQTRRGYLIILGLLLFSIYMYGIGRIYGLIFYPDEFGYWASAANILGYDWSDITSLGSYYSFGYSLILAPILYLFPHSVSAYRAAVSVNVILLFLTLIILTKIVKVLIPELEDTTVVLCAGIAAFYPTWLFYMQTTLVEILVVFTYTLSSYLFLRFITKPTWQRLACSVLEFGYLYTLHLRTVAILVAAVMTLLIWFWKEPKYRKIIVFTILLLAVAFIGGNTIKQLVQSQVYQHNESQMLAGNDYQGQVWRIKSIFSINGLIQLGVSFLGKIYYLGIASFGLFYWGIGYAIQQITQKENNNKEHNNHRLFYIYLLLTIAGAIAVDSIYTKGYGRIDALFYGRYDEYILPVIMTLGVYGVWKSTQNIRKIFFFAVYGCITTGILEYIIQKYELTNYHEGYFCAGLSYLMRYIDFDTKWYLWKAYLFGTALTIAMIWILHTFGKKSITVWMVSIVIIIEACLSIQLNERYTYRYNLSAHGDRDISDVVEDMAAAGRRIVYYGDSDEDAFISSIRFTLKDQPFTLLKAGEEDKLEQQDVILVASEQLDLTYIEEHYTECKVYGGSFWVFLNEDTE